MNKTFRYRLRKIVTQDWGGGLTTKIGHFVRDNKPGVKGGPIVLEMPIDVKSKPGDFYEMVWGTAA